MDEDDNGKFKPERVNLLLIRSIIMYYVFDILQIVQIVINNVIVQEDGE